MTAAAHLDHDQPYPADYLATILKEVRTIAMVGASSDPTKFSYGVLRVLHETGYDMIPVNPNEAEGQIRELTDRKATGCCRSQTSVNSGHLLATQSVASVSRFSVHYLLEWLAVQEAS